MKHIVITGGTRGIGLGMVKDFLCRGCRVVFTGTSDLSLNRTHSEISNEFPGKEFKGVVCDVRKFDDVKKLWDFSHKLFGPVDIWINNAGITNEQLSFVDIDPAVIDDIININLISTMKATAFVYRRMKESGREAFIYNMGGLGSDGRIIKGLTPYGVSKRAVQYFVKAFAKETEGSCIKTGLIIPGMVLTDMLLDPIRNKSGDVKQLTRVCNMLAEEVDDVTPVLVNRILENENNGAIISYTRAWKMMLKVPCRLITGRDIVGPAL